MVRAHDEVTKVHYQGSNDDFVVMVSSAESVKKWKDDKTVPLVDVVDSFDVFHTNKHGAQGQLDRASNALLENEFGTKKEEDVVKQILEKGNVQESKSDSKQGGKNESKGIGASNTNAGVHG